MAKRVQSYLFLSIDNRLSSCCRGFMFGCIYAFCYLVYFKMSYHFLVSPCGSLPEGFFDETDFPPFPIS
ncbi:MAG: hypothetical protein OXC61_02360, partial [Flavobacteriaceae bacterium]|nr:hypothetical protein [Flavobacteriaceae bacterium]